MSLLLLLLPSFHSLIFSRSKCKLLMRTGNGCTFYTKLLSHSFLLVHTSRIQSKLKRRLTSDEIDVMSEFTKYTGIKQFLLRSGIKGQKKPNESS
jgi:hypothetical protein